MQQMVYNEAGEWWLVSVLDQQLTDTYVVYTLRADQALFAGPSKRTRVGQELRVHVQRQPHGRRSLYELGDTSIPPHVREHLRALSAADHADAPKPWEGMAHIELVHGSGDDDPATWQLLAKLWGPETGEPYVDYSSCPPELRETAERHIRYTLNDTARAMVTIPMPDGTHAESWLAKLEFATSSTSNWYGDLHWRRRGKRPPR